LTPALNPTVGGSGHTLKHTVLALLFSMSLSVAGRAAAADAPSQADIDSATVTLERAMDGDEASIGPAAEQFARLLAQSPADPLLMVYSGAATALRADATLLPWRKMRFAEDGLAQIDKALALLTSAHDTPRSDGTPVALETRFVAASTFLSLPGFFNRRARGERLLKDVMASPMLGSAALSFRGAVWLRAGLQAIEDKRKDDARRWLSQVVASNAPQAAAARARLKEMGS
jgi:hypothetical protein